MTLPRAFQRGPRAASHRLHRGRGRGRYADPVMETEPLRDLIEALQLRRLVALSTALGVVVLGLALSYLFPNVIPPHPLVGAAVGLAALTIGIVAAVAADAGDEIVRGARHVLATGAAVAAEGPGALDQLEAWAEEQAAGAPQISIAVVGAGTGAPQTAAIAEAIGYALASAGRRVLVADLAEEHGDEPGLAEVGRGEVKLSKAVTFETDVDLARVRSGTPLTDALVTLPRIAPRLVGDVEVLVSALPGLRQPATLLGATAAGRSLLVAVAGTTTRVDVIAGIQALDAAQAPADVVILPAEGIATREPSVAEALLADPEADEVEEGSLLVDPLDEPAETWDVEPRETWDAEEDGASEEPEPETEPVAESEPETESETADEVVAAEGSGSEDAAAADEVAADEVAESDDAAEHDEVTGFEPGAADHEAGPVTEAAPADDPSNDEEIWTYDWQEDEGVHDPTEPFEPISVPGTADRRTDGDPAPAPEPFQPSFLDTEATASAPAEVRDELQRIASVIALERELVDRDDEADGVA